MLPLLAVGVIALPSPPAGAAAGLPVGTKLVPSGTIKIYNAGAVVDGKDVTGQIYVFADNVTIRRSRVTNGGYNTIRIESGVQNVLIEDVDVVCTSNTTIGPAWSDYTARRVAVTGCKKPFVEGANTAIYDSSWNGAPVGTVTTAPPATTTTTTAPPATTTTTTAPPATGRIDRAAVIAGAGVRNESVLRPSGSITVSQQGAVVENLDINGSISVAANDVTIRNVRVTGSSPAALIRPERGVTGTTIEYCEVTVTAEGANGAIGHVGSGTTVRFCEISGFADGIKAESASLYENNYIHMAKPAGSTKHLDGIQGSGDSDYVIRNNVIEVPIADGGNAAIFVQAWNGAANFHVRNVTISNNYLKGGNYTVFLSGGKDSDGSDPASWIHDYYLLNNTFDPNGYRYGSLRVANCAETTISGNVLVNGSPLSNPC